MYPFVGSEFRRGTGSFSTQVTHKRIYSFVSHHVNIQLTATFKRPFTLGALEGPVNKNTYASNLFDYKALFTLNTCICVSEW